MHPFAAAGKRMSRRSAKYPCQRHERNEQRAVGNAGSYAVRHCRAVRGSGSGSYRRVPEPVIARHPRGTWKRQQGETYKRFDAEPFYTAVVIGQGKSKNHWFWAASFSIFLSLLKEIWPPEAYMQDAGAARNRRTKNGPSGRQPLRGARPKPRETTRARGAEYLFYILPQKHKRLQRKVSFSRRGSLYLDRRRVSAPLPAACYQLSCVLYCATIRQIGICEIHIF